MFASNTAEGSSRPKVVIVGAGVGGLCAAIDLAHRGAEVAIVERASQVGGKMREIRVDGQAIDVGPTVLTMAQVFEGLFQDVGYDLRDFVTLQRLDLLARHGWVDGSRLDLFTDIERSAAEITRFADAAEADGFRRFCTYAAKIFQAVEGPFMRTDRPGVGPVIRATGLNGFAFDWHRSMWRALGDFFQDPRLRQLFARYATYYGSSPFRTPGTLNLIFHVERMGVWTVLGGMAQLARGLRKLAEALGVEVHLEREVDHIETSHGRVCAVRSGTRRFAADAVVVNAAPSALAAGLFGSEVAGALGKSLLPKPARSLSAVTIAAYAKAEGFPLAHHNVFFSEDYEAEFKALFSDARIPREPTVYACAQDRGAREPPPPEADREVGEPERLFFLVNAPPVGDRETFEGEIPSCLSNTTRQLARCGLRVDLDSATTNVTSPREFEHLFPTTGGALYGPATHGFMVPFQRPPARTKVRGLYLAGGGAHPGAGVPMVAMSGRIAARAIAADLRLTSTRRQVDTSGGTSTPSRKTGPAPSR